jgi:hypothetical protein
MLKRTIPWSLAGLIFTTTLLLAAKEVVPSQELEEAEQAKVSASDPAAAMVTPELKGTHIQTVDPGPPVLTEAEIEKRERGILARRTAESATPVGEVERTSAIPPPMAGVGQTESIDILGSTEPTPAELEKLERILAAFAAGDSVSGVPANSTKQGAEESTVDPDGPQGLTPEEIAKSVAPAPSADGVKEARP